MIEAARGEGRAARRTRHADETFDPGLLFRQLRRELGERLALGPAAARVFPRRVRIRRCLGEIAREDVRRERIKITGAHALAEADEFAHQAAARMTHQMEARVRG